jgi:hypothetical protein
VPLLAQPKREVERCWLCCSLEGDISTECSQSRTSHTQGVRNAVVRLRARRHMVKNAIPDARRLSDPCAYGSGSRVVAQASNPWTLAQGANTLFFSLLAGCCACCFEQGRLPRSRLPLPSGQACLIAGAVPGHVTSLRGLRNLRAFAASRPYLRAPYTLHTTHETYSRIAPRRHSFAFPYRPVMSVGGHNPAAAYSSLNANMPGGPQGRWRRVLLIAMVPMLCAFIYYSYKSNYRPAALPTPP